jgi:hypothetical protein
MLNLLTYLKVMVLLIMHMVLLIMHNVRIRNLKKSNIFYGSSNNT